MAWIKSYTILGRHRKVIELAKKLRLKPAHLIGHLHLLWHSALEQQENGDLSKWSDDLIHELSGLPPCEAPQWIRLLQEHGWLNGKLIHDWWDVVGKFLQSKYSHQPEKWQAIEQLHNSSKAAEQLQSSSKAAAHQIKIRSDKIIKPNPPNPPSGGEVCQNDIEKRFEELWEAYPLDRDRIRKGKKRAFAHFRASVKCEQDLADIKQALENYKATDSVRKGYVQNGATWFNNWRDFVKKLEIQVKLQGIPQKESLAKKKIEALSGLKKWAKVQEAQQEAKNVG